MTKRIFLVHGWGGAPDGNWFPWLKRELESKNFLVTIPTMPDTFKPKIEDWVKKLGDTIGEIDKDTYLIGHSIGCQTIMRYLETLSGESKVGGVIFVAGFFNLSDGLWDEEYTKEIAEPWLSTPIDFEKIKSHTTNFIDIASDDDPYVPLSDTEIFKNKLDAKIIILKNKGHMSDDAGVKELPVVLEELNKMVETK